MIAVIQSALVYRKKPEHFGHWETYVWTHFQLSWSAAWTVFFGYWVLLVGIGCGPRGTCQFEWYSWNGHGLNVVVMLIDAFLNQMPFHSLHVWASIIYCGIWEIVSVIWWAKTGYWAYSIQDPTGFLGGAAYLFYPLMILIYVIFFFWGKLFQSLLNRIAALKRRGKLPAEWYEDEEDTDDKEIEMQP